MADASGAFTNYDPFAGEAYVEGQVHEMLHGARRGTETLNDPRRMCLALIEITLRDLTGQAKRRGKHAQAARRWVLADYDSSIYPDIKTFVGCCMTLGLDPDSLRSRVLALADCRRAVRGTGYSGGPGTRRRPRPSIVPLRGDKP